MSFLIKKNNLIYYAVMISMVHRNTIPYFWFNIENIINGYNMLSMYYEVKYKNSITHTHTHTQTHTHIYIYIYIYIYIRLQPVSYWESNVIYSHNKYTYIHMYMFMQHHNDTINNQTDAQW